MTYTVVDENGTGRDLVSNAGLERLRQAASPALKAFLEDGVADKTQTERIAAEAPEEGEWAYLRELFSDLAGTVVLSNGVEEEVEE